jgi:hypothetical protein
MGLAGPRTAAHLSCLLAARSRSRRAHPTLLRTYAADWRRLLNKAQRAVQSRPLNSARARRWPAMRYGSDALAENGCLVRGPPR